MIGPTSPCAAYREDLAASGTSVLEAAPPEAAFREPTHGPAHGAWLIAAELLTRLAPSGVAAGRGDAAVAAAARDALRALLRASPGASNVAPSPAWDLAPDAGAENDGIEDDAALAPRVVALADAMEAGGAPRLAWATLVLLPRALPGLSRGTLGLALVQRARIARKLGDLDVASTLYDDATRAGRAAGDAGLVVRATIGRGVIARVRGNYPEARARFAAGAREAARRGYRDLESLAHHGLLLAADAAKDYDRALRHGWAALGLAAGDPAREAELLANLAAVCGAAGAPTAAVHGYLAAANRASEARVRIPALAGAAVAAALADDVTLVRNLTAAVRPAVAAAGAELPYYEAAQAGALLARAWALSARSGGARGEEARWSQEFASAARAMAERHRFHEILHTLDQLEAEAAPPAADAIGGAVLRPGSGATSHTAAAPTSPARPRLAPGDGGRDRRPVAGRSRPARAVVAALASLPVGDQFAPTAWAAPASRGACTMPAPDRRTGG